MKVLSLENILKISMLLIAGIAAYFSIYGLANIFSSAFISVIIMGSALEIGKLVSVSILYRFWKHFHWVLKLYLIIAVIILMAITSLGIFGYLSAAYQEDSISLVEIKTKIVEYDQQINYKNSRLSQIENDIVRTPASYITKRMELKSQYQPELTQLQSDIKELMNKKTDLKLKEIHTKAHIGPIIYIAEVLDKSIDDAILYIVFLIMIVFDPLAIGLTIGYNSIIVKRQIEHDLLMPNEIGSEPEPSMEPDFNITKEKNKQKKYIENMSKDSMILYKNKLLSYNRVLTPQEKRELQLINVFLDGESR